MESAENTKLTKATSEKDKDQFYLLFFVVCCAIFGLGWVFGSANFDSSSSKDSAYNSQAERVKIVFPLLLGIGIPSGFLFLVDRRITGIKEQSEHELSQKKHELERAIPSEYRYPIEMDFLSVYYQKNEDVPDISYEDFCPKIRGFCDSRGGIKEKTKNYIKQHHSEAIREILAGLDIGFSEDETGCIPFYVLAREACNHALKLDLGTTVEWAELFYEDITLYLNAWLRCSVRYGIAIPIRPFIIPLKKLGEEVKLDGRSTERYLGEEAIGHYFEEDSYIQAIEYIRDTVLKDQAILPYFRTKESRDIVKEYLGKLVDLLKGEKKDRAFQNEHLSYVRESGDSL